MAERFTRIYTLPEELYFPGAPVLIAAGALLKDNQTGQILGQLKIKNISAKEIKAATVKLTVFDTAGRKLEAGAEQQYLDLQIGRDNDFGETVPILIADGTVRSYTVAVTEVVFADNTIWSGDNTPWEKQIILTPLDEKLTDPELIKQYGINLEKTPNLLKCVPQEQEDLWICTCGAINRQEETNCHRCANCLTGLQDALDLEKLEADKNIRLETARQKVEQEAKEKAEKLATTKEKTKKYAICAIVVAAIAWGGVLGFQAMERANNYKEVVALYEAGEYDAAVSAYAQSSFRKKNEEILSYWRNKNAQTISASNGHTVGLKSDGTVVAIGYNKYGQCNVDDWSDIVAISASNSHTVGLKADGTVVAAGSNNGGQCNVDNWSDIVAISAGDSHTVGLKADGTVASTGDNKNGQCNVNDWSGIVAISASDVHTVGLKADGTVVATGSNSYGQCNVNDWTNIVAISTSSNHTVGLKSDGTVVATGFNMYGQCDVDDWSDIVAISAGNSHTVGLKTDGTVVVTGYNDDRCNVQGWSDIVAISATFHTVGLKSDGTVVATGNNDYGKCDVQDWSGIKLPER